jgi:hypothetical protein
MQLPKHAKHLLMTTLAATLLAVSPAATMAQALPPPPPGCPEGWVAVEPSVNHRIRCVPDGFAPRGPGGTDASGHTAGVFVAVSDIGI